MISVSWPVHARKLSCSVLGKTLHTDQNNLSQTARHGPVQPQSTLSCSRGTGPHYHSDHTFVLHTPLILNHTASSRGKCILFINCFTTFFVKLQHNGDSLMNLEYPGSDCQIIVKIFSFNKYKRSVTFPLFRPDVPCFGMQLL